jgi:hypothetical protein
MMKDALSKWDKLPKDVRPVDIPEHGKNDQGFYRELPKDGQIVKVYTRCLEKRNGRLQKLAENKIGNLSAVDHLWIQHSEVKKLGKLIASGGGQISNGLSLRIAKFHLRDNTRGEPRDWKKDELKEWSLKVDVRGKVSGNFLISSSDGEMGYEGKIKGLISVHNGRLTKFEILVLGKHWGHSRYTQGARPGKASMGQVFRLSDGKRASDRIPPQGIRWAAGYWNPET